MSPNKQSAKGATFALLAAMVTLKTKAISFTTLTSRSGKAILRVYIKPSLRHAVAKHDPNAERQDILLLYDRTYSRKHNSKISNRRKI